MKKLILWTAFLSVPAFAADLPYVDADFGCITQAQADRYVKDFGIDARSFGGVELCRGDVDTKKLFNDLLIVEAGQFANSGQNNLIRGFVPGDQYYPWLRSMTRGIRRGQDVPYATAYNSGGYFTMQDGWAKLSTLGRVGTVVHEARHTEGYRHYPCNQGSYAGASTSACDRDYQTGGSHAVEMEYYARVTVQGRNFHPVYKSMARLMAMARANFVFNQAVLRPREAILAVTKGTSVPVLFDRGQAAVREAPSVTGWLKRTSFGAAIFNGARAFSIEMYERTGVNAVIPDAYSYFKLISETGEPVKDFEEYDVGVKRYAVVLRRDDSVAAYRFPQGEWGPARPAGLRVARTATTLENGTKGFFLISDAGAIHPFDGERSQTGAAIGSWNPNVVNVALDEAKRPVVLNADGRLRLNGADWAPAGNNVWADVTNVPLYDAFDVVK